MRKDFTINGIMKDSKEEQMQQIQINNKYLEFQNGIISYRSPTVEKVISYNKDDEKSFIAALMQIINLIEFK